MQFLMGIFCNYVQCINVFPNTNYVRFVMIKINNKLINI